VLQSDGDGDGDDHDDDDDDDDDDGDGDGDGIHDGIIIIVEVPFRVLLALCVPYYSDGVREC
jgi:hypothetical protein